jgi:hypothetical protein
MRTTLTLDEPIATALKNAAHRSGKPFKQVVNETLRAGLRAGKASTQVSQSYRLKPSSLGGPLTGANLDKALQLADAMEDQALRHKFDQRK